MVGRRAGLHVVALLAGHRDLRTTQRYAGADDGDVEGAIAATFETAEGGFERIGRAET